ncbi:MAG: DUF983 domain-containing protein [Alphaproteobacteria bacterium]|nr:MAG: DUF983 domain-containing protein [Alphaproteobacteria bacterium]
MTGYSTPSPLSCGLRLCCPRCGAGNIFSSFLKVKPRCLECNLNLAEQDSGDGPATFGIFILGFIFSPLVLWYEFSFNPPAWHHFVIWPILLAGAGYWILPRIKSAMIALEYKNHILAGQHEE